jgi:hypothetical protein
MTTTKKWTLQLTVLTSDFTDGFANLTIEQLNWKPNPSAWSIGQIIDHIITVNETYFPVVEQLKQGTYRTPWTGRLPFLVQWFGEFILKGVEPQRKRKVKTFQIWEPAQSDIPGGILQRFAEHQKKLGEMMASCENFIQAGAVISSPANRFIVYKLETAFDIIVAHERRHLNQALEVLGLMKKNG